MFDETQVFNAVQKPDINQKNEVAEFLFNNLDEFGDAKEDILKCIDYSVKDSPSFGGFTITGRKNGEIICAVVVNQTGMEGYIPENILVYIATHHNFRGKGVGKAMMKEAIDLAKGSIALHVEPNNPAKFLYEKLGFTNKYLEMRLTKNV